MDYWTQKSGAVRGGTTGILEHLLHRRIVLGEFLHRKLLSLLVSDAQVVLRSEQCFLDLGEPLYRFVYLIDRIGELLLGKTVVPVEVSLECIEIVLEVRDA